MADFSGKVLVLGASGETGERVVRSLQAKAIAVRAMVRSEKKAQGLSSETTDVFVGSVLQPNELQKAMQGVTVVISTLGTRVINDPAEIEAVDYTAIANAIAAAKEAYVRQFVLCTSIGTDAPERIPFLTSVLRVKRRAEDALQASGLTYTIVHPGGLVNTPGGQGVLLSHTPLMGGKSISRNDVAEVLVQALLQPEACNTSVYILSDPEAGPATRQQLFARAL